MSGKRPCLSPDYTGPPADGSLYTRGFTGDVLRTMLHALIAFGVTEDTLTRANVARHSLALTSSGSLLATDDGLHASGPTTRGPVARLHHQRWAGTFREAAASNYPRLSSSRPRDRVRPPKRPEEPGAEPDDGPG